MRRLIGSALVLVVLAALLPGAAAAAGPQETINGTTYARVDDGTLVLGNSLVERTWARDAFRTTSLVDKRAGLDVAGEHPDFSLSLAGAKLTSDLFTVETAQVVEIDDGLRLELALAAPTLEVSRVVEVYDGVAGFRTETTLLPTASLTLGGYSLDEVATGPGSGTTIHAFRAGADWRDAHYEGPQFALGDKHSGTWRDSRKAPAGQPIEGPAQWISIGNETGSVFMVMERNDQPSSRASFDGDTGRVEVDLSRDVIILGPFEENGHIENPTPLPGRHRVLRPGVPLRLEPVFTGVGNGDGDEEWQFHQFLIDHRLNAYDKDITFNSNGTDANRISTGAKDDMDYETVLEVAPIAKRLGVETFILDDGWQAISGDWYPDCPEHPEPRWDGDPNSKFAPRFPDCDFTAVKEAIAPMKLGLWMNAMHFHPASETFKSHPEWACAPVGHGLAAANAAEPNSSSNEAGLGTWGPDAIPHVESRIRNAITAWGVEYFKFDFLVWLDCAGQGDIYDYREAFIAMLDRLQVDFPDVTFQVDETNDYRLFPFESVSRGPSWFQNGSPEPPQLLHNLWNLSPYVPAFSLGQHTLGGRAYRDYSVDTLMAIAMTGHITFFDELRGVPGEVVDSAAPWLEFYKEHRGAFTQLIYPLLGDPIEEGWTALQSWNPEEGRGALLAFRQKDGEATQTISLRNVPAGMTFDLISAPSGERVATVTSEQLTSGIEVSLPIDGAQVLVIEPTSDTFDPSTSLTLSSPEAVKLGDMLTLTAALSGSEGAIEGATITFTFRGQTLATTTDDGGIASVSLRAAGPPGTYEIVSSFAGDGRYLASEDRSPVRIATAR